MVQRGSVNELSDIWVSIGSLWNIILISFSGTYLSLYNCDPWTKTTKTCGTMNIEDPRFNLITFTQPHGAMAFAQK